MNTEVMKYPKIFDPYVWGWMSDVFDAAHLGVSGTSVLLVMQNAICIKKDLASIVVALVVAVVVIVVVATAHLQILSTNREGRKELRRVWV